MNVLDKLRKMYKQYPTISKLGYPVLKKYWSIKSEFINYEFPENGKATVDFDLVKEYNKERVFGPKKRICYAAFNNMHFQMNGDVTSCSFNYDVKIGNIKNQSIREIWNSKEAIQFREDIGNYNLDRCFSCKKVLLAKNFASYPPLKYDLHSSENYDYPTQMSFETSDICNYSCIMCNEHLSSSIKKDKNIPFKKSVYTKDFVDQLKEFIPHLQTATFIGGEPLLIKTYYDIWEMIVSKNPNCKIHIQSNGSILTEKFLKLLPSGQFDIGISLDAATKEVFERIRLKSNFDEVIKNIYTLKEYERQGKITMNFNFCPLTLNWEELPKVLELANELEVSLKIVHVSFPLSLSLMHQNAGFLDQVIAKLEAHPLNNNSNIGSLNNKTFTDFIKNLNYYKEESIKKYNYIKIFLGNNYIDNLGYIKEIISKNNKFNYFSEDQRNILFAKIKEYSQFTDVKLNNYIVANLIFIFDETNEEIEGELSTNFDAGLKVAIDIMEQLQKNYENNLVF